MDSNYYTKTSSTIKYVSVISVVFIAVNNGLGPIAGDIVNELYTAPFVENIWSCCGA